jgi:hypothetical protein
MASGSNGYDGEQLQRFLKQIGKQHDELDKLKSEHMGKCKGPRGKIKETMKAAREAEIDMPALRVKVAQHLAERKHQKRVEALEADSAEALELINAALGDLADTPLGKAATARSRPKAAPLEGIAG